MTETRSLLAALLIIAPSFSLNAQVTSEARLDAARGRILRDARALGLQAYEDFPVSAAGAPLPVPAPPPTSPAPKSFYTMPQVPEPAPSPALQDNSMPMGNTAGYAVVAWHAIAAAIADSGLLFWRDAAPGFEEISRSAEAAVGATRYASRRSGESSLLEEEGFVAEMEGVTGARFLEGNSASPLIDGPASFEAKDRLIRGARKSVYIASYAFYDDVTGREAADMLLERRRAGVDVKVMVDDKMANVFGKALLERMRAGGVDVLRYRDADRPHDYLHMKILIVDGESAIVGGMNFGDPYSHKGGGLKWRDTDVLYTGPAVTETLAAFAREWNARYPDRTRHIAMPAAAAARTGQARIASLPQNPPTLSPAILNSILKAMAGATRRINVENAYIVAIPAFERAVLAARARGVEVNILTNSKESIDSDGKSMADLIVKGTRVFAAAGANVYLKRGETLHSKFLTVDGVYANVGSYNLHPRSERYDAEFNVAILDRGAAAALDAAFERDIAAAKKMTLAELERTESGFLSRLLNAVGYSQLSPG